MPRSRARGRTAPKASVEVKAQPIHGSAYYTRVEAAAVLRLTAQELRAEVTAGRLPCDWHGRRQAFWGADLLAWAESRRRPGSLPPQG